jgi:LCP family protein required for cell wall assembly
MAGRHTKKNKQPDQSRRLNKRIFWTSFTGTALLLTIGGGIVYHFITRPLTHGIASSYPTPSKEFIPPVKKNTEDAQRTNILLIGTDTRPHQTGGNTDVLILCSIDPKNKRIELMSVPRDTKLLYPDGSYAKINEGLMLGGPQLTENLVENLLDQPIDHYALTHFGGLIDIINTIGGITVNVPERMYYNTGDKQYNIINLNKGVQTLNGVQALGFVRFRHDALGDIGRTMRQQVFMKALADKLLQPQNITKLPTLIREFWSTVDTDMNLLDVLSMASHADQYKGYQIIHETLPGSFHNPNPKIPHDESYWIVNPLEAKYVANEFFKDGIVVKNPIQTPSVTQNWAPPTSNGMTNGTNNVPATQPTLSSSPQNGQSTDASNSTDTNTAASGAANSGTPLAQQMVVTASSAYIRNGPGTQSPVVASVLQGEKVWVVDKTGNWYKVEVANGQYGYIADWLVSTSKP